MNHLAKARWAGLALLFGLLAACSGIETQVDPSPGFRAGDYRNYAWATPPLVDSRDAQLLQIDRVVRAAVDDELGKRGFVQVKKDAAAGLVDYRLASQMDVSHAGSNSPRDDAARALDLNRNSATDVAVYNHPTLPYLQRLELMLSIQAQNSGDVVWQGKATKNVDNANPGEQFATADIQRAVGMLMQQLKDSDK
jgi:hypothetical protein